LRRAARLILMSIALIGEFLVANIMSRWLPDGAYLIIFPSMVALFLGAVWVCQRMFGWRISDGAVSLEEARRRARGT